MDLRKSHRQTPLFDAFLVGVAVFGLFVAWLSFASGGAWNVLGILALAGEALLFWGCFIEPHRVTVAVYRERLRADAQVWVKVAFLSDFHAGEFHSRECYRRIVTEVQALHPHLIVLGGDFVADRAEPVADLEDLEKLSAPLGKFFVLGNHDHLDRPQAIRDALKSWGYEDLTNRTIKVAMQGRGLEVAGLDDNWFGRPIKTKRGSPDTAHLTIAHEPDLLLDLKEGETDLLLAGHTHSGQVRLPIVGPLLPVPAILGRAVDRGRKVVNGVPTIISNGLGETDGRLRLFSPPQIVIVEVGI
jgi:hypothetical protein